MSDYRALDFGYATSAPLFSEQFVFPNGKALMAPGPLKSQRGGWYYHPILKQKNGKPSVLGRADEGRDKAKEAAAEILQIVYDRGDWQIPTAVTPVGEYEVTNNDSLGRHAMSWTPNTNYGFMYFGIGPKNSFRRDEAHVVHMILPTAVVTALTGTIYELQKPSTKLILHLDTDNVPDFVDNYRENGLQAFADYLRTQIPDRNTDNSAPREIVRPVQLSVQNRSRALQIKGEDTIKSQDFNNRLADFIEGIKLYQPFDSEAFEKAKEGYAAYTHRTEVTPGDPNTDLLETSYQMTEELLVMSKTFRDNYMDQNLLDVVNVLESAFSHLDVEFKVETARMNTSEGIKTVLRSFSVDIPEGGKHNSHGHTFKITPSGAQVVSCGYVADEERFIDDAARQAISDIAELIN